MEDDELRRAGAGLKDVQDGRDVDPGDLGTFKPSPTPNRPDDGGGSPAKAPELPSQGNTEQQAQTAQAATRDSNQQQQDQTAPASAPDRGANQHSQQPENSPTQEAGASQQQNEPNQPLAPDRASAAPQQDRISARFSAEQQQSVKEAGSNLERAGARVHEQSTEQNSPNNTPGRGPEESGRER